ncbi:MAG: phosphatase PAP2 family protein [Bacteroidota bacterium]
MNPPVRWYTMFENMPKDWSRWGKTSFRSETAMDWAAISALTAVLIATDDATYSPSESFYHSSSSAKYWSDFCAEIGDGRTQFTLAGAFAAYGLLFEDNRAWRTGSQIVEAVLASGAVVQVLKHVTGRESPYVRSVPLGRWSVFPNQIDYHRYVPYYDAFPSGHICTSLATVIVIAENYPEVSWIRPAGYVFTTLVGVGMANNGIHWYSDYPLGLFIGYYFGMLAAHPEGWSGVETKAVSGTHVSLLPSITTRGTGFSLTVSF